MKRLLTLFVLVGGIALGNITNAQTFKFGHINGQELVSIMPERDSAQAQLENLTKEITDQIELMQVEYNNKYQDYVNKRETLSDVIRQAREQELNDMGQRIQEFQAGARQQIQMRESELIQPIMQKAEKAIEKVGKDNGFTYIFDISAGGVLFFSEQSIDIMPLVKAELGITE